MFDAFARLVLEPSGEVRKRAATRIHRDRATGCAAAERHPAWSRSADPTRRDRSSPLATRVLHFAAGQNGLF
jgi:hypothetical protein